MTSFGFIHSIGTKSLLSVPLPSAQPHIFMHIFCTVVFFMPLDFIVEKHTFLLAPIKF